MNKKLLAVAVAAGLAAPMYANAGATLYGHLQAEIASTDSDFKSNPGFDGHIVNPGGVRILSDGVGINDERRGRLGVKGSEDLGGGLKAIYKFEFQVETTTADVDENDREAFVGLKGGWGVFKIGAVKTPYKYFGGVKYDPFVTTAVEARRWGGMTQGRFGHNAFFQRSLSYEFKTGPSHFWLTYSPTETESNLQSDGNTGVSGSGATNGASPNRDGDYSVGYKFSTKKWEAFVAAVHQEDISLDPFPLLGTETTESYDAVKIGGKISFGGGHSIVAQYESTTEEQTGATPDEDGEVLLVGYRFKFGKNLFTADVASGTVEFGGATPDQDNDFFRVGFIHKFNKKSKVFVGYSSSEYDNLNGSTAATNTGDRSAVTIGLRHDF